MATNTSSPTLLLLNPNTNKLKFKHPFVQTITPFNKCVLTNVKSGWTYCQRQPITTTKALSMSPSITTETTKNNNNNNNDNEEMERIKRLQNGSDIRGVAMEGEKGRSVDLTPAAVEAIAESFGEWVKDKLNGDDDGQVRISLGRDPRVSGPVLSTAVFSGLARAGCLVFDMGLATTPACFMSTILDGFAYHASIMMTASHLPYTRNGLKFFTKSGGLTSLEVEELCDRAARKYANRQAKVSLLTNPPKKVDLMSAYANHLRDIIKERINHPTNYDTPLQGFQEEKIEGWMLDSCGDCWVGEGCLVDLNETPTAIDAHMYRVKVLDKEGNEYGWVHLRQSIHNPNIAINMQSSVAGGCLSMTKLFKDKFVIASGLHKFLDLSDIEQYVKQ